MPHPFLALDVWTDPLRKALELSKAWEDFLSGDRPGAAGRPAVVSSWQRCLQQGVHPHQTRAPIDLTQAELHERWREHPLVSYLEPLAEQLSLLAEGSGHLVVLTDETGQILHLVGDKQVRLTAERMNFVPGSRWGEADAGTNAIGTALVERHPIQIFAAEHFCEPVHRWTCSATPIIDPVSGKALAVIDMTGLRETVHPHTLTAVVAAARAVEDALRDDLRKERLQLVEHYLNALAGNPRQELAVIDRGGRLIQSSPSFQGEGLVDAEGRLAGLTGESSIFSPRAWEAAGRHGTRKFELHPVFQGTRAVGALIRMGTPGTSTGRRSLAEALESPAPRHSFASLIGYAPSFREVVGAAAKFAARDLPVLIEGESGTGKELLAQAIHTASPRAMRPFIAVNCGAIPKDLLASEFFGYEAGSFTGGARGGRAGKFEAADGGTIFLDEIGEMPLDAQVYLLRVLEQGEVVRLGAKMPVKADVRVIAATNRDLAAAVKKGAFRQDLYYRLNVLSVRMPPLRERADDVILLMNHFLERACKELARDRLKLSEAAVSMVRAYPWPGNVREVRNLAYRLALIVTDAVAFPGDLPAEMRRHLEDTAHPDPVGREAAPAGPRSAEAAAPSGEEGQPLILRTAPLPELERAAFEQAWIRYGGQASAVAQALGISRATAYRKAHQFGLLESSKGERVV